MNNTLVKGLALLEVLARSPQPLGVTELAQRLSLPKSNVHRLLQGLVELHFVRRIEGAGGYKPCLRLWQLGSAVIANFDLRRVAAPLMETLLERTRESVHLSVLDGGEVIYVDKLDSPEPVRTYSQVGGRAPAHCVATGKAMLAFQPAAQLDLLARHLEAHSPRTLTERAAFLREMARIRDTGFAVNRGEWRESVVGVAAPICDDSGKVIAAIGISGPIERLGLQRLRRYGPMVAAIAGEATQQLAQPPSPDPMPRMLHGMRRNAATRTAASAASSRPASRRARSTARA